VGFGVYALSKFALEGLTEALREEVRPFGIDVSLVEPGFVKTKFVSHQLIPSPPMPGPGRQQSIPSARASRAMEPELVGRVIVRALTTRPRLRYQAGRSATALVLPKRVIPQSIFEQGLRRAFSTRTPADLESHPHEERHRHGGVILS
jgi:short-subunit dehydrogenase